MFAFSDNLERRGQDSIAPGIGNGQVCLARWRCGVAVLDLLEWQGLLSNNGTW